MNYFGIFFGLCIPVILAIGLVIMSFLRKENKYNE